MAEQDRRPEATHRQRAAMGDVGMIGPPIGANGRPMAFVSNSASDLLPTVQFGNILVGPVTIARWVEDDGDDAVIQASQKNQQAAEFVCGQERRIIQWAIDPSKKIENPVTGAVTAPSAPAPAAPQAPQQAAPVPQPQPQGQPISTQPLQPAQPAGQQVQFGAPAAPLVPAPPTQ